MYSLLCVTTGEISYTGWVLLFILTEYINMVLTMSSTRSLTAVIPSTKSKGTSVVYHDKVLIWGIDYKRPIKSVQYMIINQT